MKTQDNYVEGLGEIRYNYHLVAYSPDCGEDDKNDCPTYKNAVKWAKLHVKNGWEKVNIWKHFTSPKEQSLLVAEVTSEGIRRITNHD